MSVSSIALLSSLLLFGPLVSAQAADSKDTLPEGIVASINGRPISQIAIDNVSQQLTSNGEAANREQILDELINLELLTQEAEKQKLDEDPEVAAALQLQYTQTMANAYLAEKSTQITFSESELRAEYEAQTEVVDRAEFRASHILLDSEADALAVLKEISTGKSFEELAKTRSIDPAGENGGDLGWFQNSTLPPEFTQAVAKMEIGEVSQPVKTEYGYHVIKLDDKRESALPDYESVKPGLTNLAIRKALSEHVNELRSKADIVIE